LGRNEPKPAAQTRLKESTKTGGIRARRTGEKLMPGGGQGGGDKIERKRNGTKGTLKKTCCEGGGIARGEMAERKDIQTIKRITVTMIQLDHTEGP